MKQESARKRFVAVLAAPPAYMARGLEEKRVRAAELAARDDVLWYLLLQSMSTLQSSAGHVHIFPGADKEPLATITHEALSRLTTAGREKALRHAFSKVRYGEIKAVRLAWNFDFIESMGGLHEATSAMRTLANIDAKKAWVRRFKGIGNKYARNFWMDIRDPHFADSIAVDSRLASVARILGMPSDDYEEQEAFFLRMARDAGITGWEADRLIYNFRTELLQEAGIDIPRKPGSGKPPSSC